MNAVIYSIHLRRDFQYRSADRFMSDDVRRSPPEGNRYLRLRPYFIARSSSAFSNLITTSLIVCFLTDGLPSKHCAMEPEQMLMLLDLGL